MGSCRSVGTKMGRHTLGNPGKMRRSTWFLPEESAERGVLDRIKNRYPWSACEIFSYFHGCICIFSSPFPSPGPPRWHLAGLKTQRIGRSSSTKLYLATCIYEQMMIFLSSILCGFYLQPRSSYSNVDHQSGNPSSEVPLAQ